MPHIALMHSTQPAKFAAALLLLCMLPSLQASEHRGVIRFNESPVPGVSATAAQAEKKFKTITNLQGAYVFPDLPDGTWIITVDLFGFKPMQREIIVGPDAPELSWNLTMLPYSDMKTETIKAALPGLASEIQKTDVKSSGGAPDAPSRPVNDGTPVLPQNASSESSSPFAGLTPEQLSNQAADGFLINGSTNNAAASPLARASAFGNNRLSRALYNGSLNIFLNNSAFDARTYSLTGQEARKPDYNRSRIAFNIGGPLIIPRLINNGPYFYLGYERSRDRNATIHTSRMPTPAERSGDLSDARNPLGQPIPIFDLATGIPFANNRIPQDKISPQAQSLLLLYPLPNVAGGNNYNYQVPIVSESHQDSVRGQIYYGQISASIAWQSSRTDSPNAFGFLDTGRSGTFNAGAGYSRNLGKRTSANLQYQFERSTTRSLPFFANRVNISGDAGILGNNQSPTNWGPPNLNFSNYASLVDGQDAFDRNLSHSIRASVMLGRAEHTLRMGIDLSRQQLNAYSQQDARGTFSFTGAATGYDFADFLLGIPDAGSLAFGNADKYFRSSRFAVYVSDDWRIAPGLTLNAGVRWEYEQPVTELYGRLVNLDFAPGFSSAAPTLASDPMGLLTGRRYPSSLIHPDKRSILPRIGFAWRPAAASSLVIRGGYGISRDTSVYLPIARQMAQQSPFSKNLSVSNSPETPLTLAKAFNSAPRNIANTFAIDPDFRVALAHTWQLYIQRDLPFSLQILTMYMGIKGSRLTQKSLPNTFPLGASDSCNDCPSGFIYTASHGSSIRHAGMIQLRRRLGNGFSANLDYTYSKSIDDVGLGGSGIAQNWREPKTERALSSFDQRHLLNVQAQYTSGAGIFGPKVLSGWKGAFLREWTLSGMMAISSGRPLTPIYSAAVPGTGITGVIRPSLAGVPVTAKPDGLFLNPAAYMAPGPGEWGTAGRNSITGPDQFSLSASLGRAFRLRDRYNIEFRLESSNILNHVSYPSWNTTVNSLYFGLPDRANAMRRIQANLRVSF